MAEELYFLKLNQTTAKANLVDLISIEDQFSYKKHINDYSEKPIEFYQVLEKIKTDIALLSLEEFWSIFNWLSSRVEFLHSDLNYDEQQKLFSQTMKSNGIELFYEIPSKTPVRKFHNILGDYECHIQNEIHFKSNAQEFNNFLEYGICFSGELELFLNKHYYNYELYDEFEIRNQIDKINLKYGKLYHDMAIKEFNEVYEYNLETIELLVAVTDFRQKTKHLSTVSYPLEFKPVLQRESDLISLASSYYYFSELKEEIKDYSGTIVRLHSY